MKKEHYLRTTDEDFAATAKSQEPKSGDAETSKMAQKMAQNAPEQGYKDLNSDTDDVQKAPVVSGFAYTSGSNQYTPQESNL